MTHKAARIADEKRQRAIPRKLNFTEATLRALRCPAGKRVAWVYDARVGALAFAVTDRGARSFYFYRKHHGRPVRKKIGSLDKMTLDQARKVVVDLNAQYNVGVDAIAQRSRLGSSITVGELWSRYEREHLQVNATPKTLSVDSSTERICLADWRHRPIATLTEDDCRKLHRSIAAKHRGRTANRGLQLLQRLCNWARLPVPFDRREIDWFPERSRERYLEESEVRKLMAAIDAGDDPDLADFVTLALVTGARRENLASMSWAEIDLDSQIWRIPAAKAKAKAAIPLPLAPDAVKILQRRRRAMEGRDSPYVFPSPLGDDRHRTGNNFHRAFAAAREVAGLPDVHLHDLRRTLGSWMAAQGVSLPTIGKALGHASTEATEIYARLGLAPVRKAVDAASAALMRASKPKPTRKGKGASTKKK